VKFIADVQKRVWLGLINFEFLINFFNIHGYFYKIHLCFYDNICILKIADATNFNSNCIFTLPFPQNQNEIRQKAKSKHNASQKPKPNPNPHTFNAKTPRPFKAPQCHLSFLPLTLHVCVVI